MKNPTKIIFSIIFIIALSFGCRYDKLDDIGGCDLSDVKYSTVIGPLVHANCAIPGCHDGSTYTSNYTTYAELKHRVDDGTFKSRVIDVHAMPPVNKMSDCDYKKLKLWYEAGALDN